MHEYPDTPIPTEGELARALADAPREDPPPPRARKLVVLVGEDPGPAGDPDYALHDRPDGSAGHRLRLLTGLDSRGYLGTFARLNLRRHWEERWSAPDARRRAEELLPALDGRVAVLLGARVCAAFGVSSRYVAERRAGPGGRRVVLAGAPHPSGRCREDDAVTEGRAFYALLLRWLREDPDPMGFVLGPSRGRLFFATRLSDLAPALDAARSSPRGLPELGDDGQSYLLRAVGDDPPPMPCEGCGRPWPHRGGARRHLCPACSVLASGHGL
jgi:hypothetical protein